MKILGICTNRNEDYKLSTSQKVESVNSQETVSLLFFFGALLQKNRLIPGLPEKYLKSDREALGFEPLLARAAAK